jgi:hypothetical protein
MVFLIEQRDKTPTATTVGDHGERSSIPGAAHAR